MSLCHSMCLRWEFVCRKLWPALWWKGCATGRPPVNARGFALSYCRPRNTHSWDKALHLVNADLGTPTPETKLCTTGIFVCGYSGWRSGCLCMHACVRERESVCVCVWCIHVCRFTLQHIHPTLTVTYPCCRYSYLRKAVRHYPELRDMLAQCSKCAVCGEAFLNTWLECVHFLDAKVSWVEFSSVQDMVHATSVLRKACVYIIYSVPCSAQAWATRKISLVHQLNWPVCCAPAPRPTASRPCFWIWIWIYTLQGPLWPFFAMELGERMQIKLVLKRNGLYSLSFYGLYSLSFYSV